MATRILEYSDKPRDGYPVVPARYKVAEQSAMTASASSAASSAFQANTKFVIVQSDEAIKTSFGTSPTATDNSYLIPAGKEMCFEVPPGESWKVAIKT